MGQHDAALFHWSGTKALNAPTFLQIPFPIFGFPLCFVRPPLGCTRLFEIRSAGFFLDRLTYLDTPRCSFARNRLLLGSDPGASRSVRANATGPFERSSLASGVRQVSVNHGPRRRSRGRRRFWIVAPRRPVPQHRPATHQQFASQGHNCLFLPRRAPTRQSRPHLPRPTVVLE
jgi:hypothetical protein